MHSIRHGSRYQAYLAAKYARYPEPWHKSRCKARWIISFNQRGNSQLSYWQFLRYRSSISFSPITDSITVLEKKSSEIILSNLQKSWFCPTALPTFANPPPGANVHFPVKWQLYLKSLGIIGIPSLCKNLQKMVKRLHICLKKSWKKIILLST